MHTSTVEPRYNEVELELEIRHVKIVILAFEANIFLQMAIRKLELTVFFFFVDVVQQSL